MLKSWKYSNTTYSEHPITGFQLSFKSQDKKNSQTGFLVPVMDAIRKPQHSKYRTSFSIRIVTVLPSINLVWLGLGPSAETRAPKFNPLYSSGIAIFQCSCFAILVLSFGARNQPGLILCLTTYHALINYCDIPSLYPIQIFSISRQFCHGV